MLDTIAWHYVKSRMRSVSNCLPLKWISNFLFFYARKSNSFNYIILNVKGILTIKHTTSTITTKRTAIFNTSIACMNILVPISLCPCIVWIYLYVFVDMLTACKCWKSLPKGNIYSCILTSTKFSLHFVKLFSFFTLQTQRTFTTNYAN